MHRIEVLGKPPSLNKFYSGVHWSVRKAIVDEWHTLFLMALRASGCPRIVATPINVSVTLFCKGRLLDADNVVVSAKLFCDSLVLGSYIPGDSPKYISSVTLACRKGKEDKVVVMF